MGERKLWLPVAQTVLVRCELKGFRPVEQMITATVRSAEDLVIDVPLVPEG